MSMIFKTFFAVVTLAICGVTFHHVRSDASPTSLVSVGTRLPEFNGSPLGSIGSKNASEPSVTSTEENVRKLQEHLAASRAAAEAMPGYTATLEMQEEVNEKLRPVDRIEFKTRREPFSVYMRWTETEQEALYVEGENDNRLIVKPTKGLAAIRRIWRLDPDCQMAKKNCRYSITDAGIENLIVRVQSFYRQQSDVPALATCEVSESTFSNRDVTIFDVHFRNEKSAPKYCASKFCFDKQTDLLIAVDNYGWSKDGKPRLIEHHVYDEIKVEPQQDDTDFAQDNPAYSFIKR